MGQEDLRQDWVQRGKSEFLVDSSGKQKRLRTWRGQEEGYSYTTLGRAYFAKNKASFIVQIPVYVEGARDGRREGTFYTRELYMPVSHFGVGQIYADQSLSEGQRIRQIKNQVLSKLHGDSPAYREGKLILHEESNETWYLDDNTRPWRISMMQTVAGQTSVSTRPLRQDGMSHSFFRWPKPSWKRHSTRTSTTALPTSSLLSSAVIGSV